MSKEATKDTPEQETAEAPPQKDPVRRWTFILLVIGAGLLVLYLVGDRYTPYTSQAKVHAYVVPVAPQVSGIVLSVDAENNQRVSAGDRLLQIDPANYQLAVNAAEAQYQNALQSVEAGSSNIQSAEASVEAARAQVWKAQQDTERMRRIRAEDPGAISERRIQSSEATLASAKSSLAAAEAALEGAVSALGATDESNAMLQQAQSGLEKARLDLERTSLAAPADGLITDLRVDAGNFASAGAPLMTFVAIHDTWVQADFTENNLGHVDVGDSVGIVFDMQPGHVYEGKVRHIGYGVAVSNNALGTLPTVDNQRTFLREAQRFPVIIEYEASEVDPAKLGLRVGSQASVIVYTGTHPFLNLLGRIQMRLHALLSYAY